MTETFCLVSGGNHHSERLPGSSLTAPERVDGRGVRGVAGKQEPSESFDGDNPAFLDLSRCLSDGIGDISWSTGSVKPLKGGTTHGASIGLGVEPAVKWICVFIAAFRAHYEFAHRGEMAIVGHIFDDGEARSTVGAVDERVSVSAVRKSEELLPALWAEGNVRRDKLILALDGQTVLD